MLSFWDCDLDTFRDAVEKEVYEAIRELLTTDDPDFLLWWFTCEEGEDPYLRLTVEGREKFEDISRRFTLSEMVDDVLDGWEGRDGVRRLEPEDRENLQRIQRALEREAARVGVFLATAKEVKPGDPLSVRQAALIAAAEGDKSGPQTT